ncbi:MAG: ice-binding family protein [Candidatus Doudnabacteria bacterium]
MQNFNKMRILPLMAVILWVVMGGTSAYAAGPSLGTAGNFTVLAGTAVTCTAPGTINGDVGVVPPGAFTNSTGCVISGAVPPATDAASVAAYGDFLNAYANIGNSTSTPCGVTLPSTLSNVTLTPGVYCTDAALTLSGILTLDGLGDPNAVWIFKIGILGTGALTGTDFSMVMTNGASACNVFWRVAEAATFTTSSFQGTILTGADITINGGTLNGNLLAGGSGTTAIPAGAVTMTGATVSGCGQPTPPNTGSISGMKFNDLNGNGKKGPGEPGLANWTITLTNQAGVVTSAVTDASGNYTFSNLADGTYAVREVNPQPCKTKDDDDKNHGNNSKNNDNKATFCWMQTAPAAGSYTVTIANGAQVTGQDFGNHMVKKSKEKECDKDHHNDQNNKGSHENNNGQCKDDHHDNDDHGGNNDHHDNDMDKNNKSKK